VSKRVEVSYVAIIDEKERQVRLAEILTEGVYSCLLKKDFEKCEKIEEVLEKTKSVDTPIDKEPMEGFYKNN
jgi:serine kinase of HPr protein (carbohydrate metabolism regulator)